MEQYGYIFVDYLAFYSVSKIKPCSKIKKKCLVYPYRKITNTTHALVGGMLKLSGTCTNGQHEKTVLPLARP